MKGLILVLIEVFACLRQVQVGDGRSGFCAVKRSQTATEGLTLLRPELKIFGRHWNNFCVVNAEISGRHGVAQFSV
jgi:hypothetical protein